MRQRGGAGAAGMGWGAEEPSAYDPIHIHPVSTRVHSRAVRRLSSLLRVRKAAQRIVAAKNKGSQGRLESFFGPAVHVPAKKKEEAKGKKGPAGKLKGGIKKAKLGGVGGGKK